MIAVAYSPLVEKVARAMWDTWNRIMAENGLHRQGNGDFDAPEPEGGAIAIQAHRLVRQAAFEEAKAALDACHAEELATALRDLLEDTQHREHDCGDTPENCPVLKARALLAKLDGQS